MTWERRPALNLGMTFDSLGYGRLAGYLEQRMWMHRFMEQVQAAPECVGEVNVVNLGQGSQTSTWAATDSVPRLAAMRLTHVLHGFTGVNDDVTTGGVPAVSMAQFQANLATIDDLLVAANPGCIRALASMNPVDTAGQALRPNLAARYAAAKAFAEGRGLDYIDNYGGMTAPGQPGGWPKPLPTYMTDSGDGLHPTGAWFDVYAMPNFVFWMRKKMAAFWGLPAPAAPPIAPLPPSRIFSVSPALGGKTEINLDAEDLLVAVTGGSAVEYTLTAQSAFTFSFVAWGEGTGGAIARGGHVGGQYAVTQGQVLKVVAARNRNGTGGGLAGIFLTSVTQANAVAVAAGAGGPMDGNSGYGGNGGAATGQNGQSGTYVGYGGTQTAGGAKGDESHGESYGATAGSALNGGNAGSPSMFYDPETGEPLGWTSGGPGGAGYFGGGGGSGGGSFAGSGGAGSNYLAPAVTSPVSERAGGRTNPRRGNGGDDYASRVVIF
jgi:hypothetical protein